LKEVERAVFNRKRIGVLRRAAAAGAVGEVQRLPPEKSDPAFAVSACR
jgi:hypothetical protein